MDMEQLTLPEENSLLIVDDDRPFRERLARAMETRGFAVKSAETVRQGVSMVNEAPPAFATPQKNVGIEIHASVNQV